MEHSHRRDTANGTAIWATDALERTQRSGNASANRRASAVGRRFFSWNGWAGWTLIRTRLTARLNGTSLPRNRYTVERGHAGTDADHAFAEQDCWRGRFQVRLLTGRQRETLNEERCVPLLNRYATEPITGGERTTAHIANTYAGTC